MKNLYYGSFFKFCTAAFCILSVLLSSNLKNQTIYAQDCTPLKTNPNNQPILPNFESPEPPKEGYIDLDLAENMNNSLDQLKGQIREEQSHAERNVCQFDCVKWDAPNFFADEHDPEGKIPGILKDARVWFGIKYRINPDSVRPLDGNKAGFTAHVTISGRVGIGGGTLQKEITKCENAGFNIRGETSLRINENWNLIPQTRVTADDTDGCNLNFDPAIIVGAGIGADLIRQALTDFVFKRLVKDKLPDKITPIIDNAISKSYRDQFNKTWKALQTPILLNSPNLKNTYLLLYPKQIITPQSQIQVSNNNINLHFQIALQPKLLINDKCKKDCPDLDVPNLVFQTNQNPDLPIEVHRDFETSSSSIENSLIATQPFKIMNLNILGVDMNGAGKDFLLKIKVDGEFRGSLFLTGKFNIVKNEIQTSCLNFKIQSRDPAKAEKAKEFETILNDPELLAKIGKKLFQSNISFDLQEAKTSMFNSLNSMNGNGATFSFHGKTPDQLNFSYQDIYAVKDDGLRFVLKLN